MNTGQRLLKIFNILLKSFGKRNWWPGETPLEIIVGAVLTQNTSWKNVQKAIQNMKNECVLDIESLYRIGTERLSEIIRPSGFYNLKANRLKNIVNVIYNSYGASIDNMANISLDELRHSLLEINGIGPETADSILLYALNRPIFVVDAYTKRFLSNHRLYAAGGDYHAVQRFFMKNLPADIYLFNEFHALIVCLGQGYCKKTPICKGCPLELDKSINSL
ncbi:MAG TPA: endonuclease III domain-containing protein [Syntrophorhabdaceae bacterium]|nr:endonuclease III domain-containing protein [Syntrophorhabdaceae bacterium]HQG50913.1 endonuclease III domain-containing protein [Syntrophorhabdaceae bacterium]HQJ94156.1 endonuclease III domain-containing protein [Syntrophorhabdaceae bacterium]